MPVRIKMICMYGSGQIDYVIIEKFAAAEYRPQDIKDGGAWYKDNILHGVKIRMSKGVDTGIDAMDATPVNWLMNWGTGIRVHTSNPVTPLRGG